MTQNLPERIKMKLTVELDFAKEDQPLIPDVLQHILDHLWLSGSGNGSRTAQSHFSYNLETNVPSEPMTMDKLFEVMDQAREPGEPSVTERMAETMHPEYDQAEAWWEALSEGQKQWFCEKHPDVKMVTKAWEVQKEMPFADRVVFEALK